MPSFSFKALLTTHLLAATTTTMTSASPLTKRNLGGVRLCDQANWGGNCWYGIMPLNECIALNSLYVLIVTSTSFNSILTNPLLSTARAKSSLSVPTKAQSAT